MKVQNSDFGFVTTGTWIITLCIVLTVFSSLQWLFSPLIFLTEIRKNVIMKQISFPTLWLLKIHGKNSSFVHIFGSLGVFSSLIFLRSRDREMIIECPSPTFSDFSQTPKKFSEQMPSHIRISRQYKIAISRNWMALENHAPGIQKWENLSGAITTYSSPALVAFWATGLTLYWRKIQN